MADEINDEGVVSLVIDARGLQRGSQEAIAEGQRLIAHLKGIGLAAAGVGEAFDLSGIKIVKSLNDQGRFLSQMERKFNPFQAELKKALTELSRLQGIMDKGGEAAGRAAQMIEGVTRKIAELQQVIAGVNPEIAKIGPVIAQQTARLDTELTKATQSLKAFDSAVESAVGRLDAKFRPATVSARQMAAELRDVDLALKGNKISGDQATEWTNKITRSYDLGAQAADRMAEAQARLNQEWQGMQAGAVRQPSPNQMLGIQLAGSDFSRQLEMEMRKRADLAEQATEDIAQQRFTELMSNVGIGTSSAVSQGAGTGEAMAMEFARQDAEAENLQRDLKMLNDAYEENARRTKEAAAVTDNLTQRFDREAYIAQQLQKNLRDLAQAQTLGIVTAKQAIAEEQRLFQAAYAQTEAGKKQAEQTRKVADENARLALSARRIADAIDPAAAEARDYAQALSVLQSMLQRNLITQLEYEKALKLSHAQLLNVTATQQSGIGVTRQAGFALTNLSFQINDVVSGLAMGQDPMRIFAQQTGQIVQIFQQYPGVLKEAAEGIRNFTAATIAWARTPVGAMVIGATAIATAFAIVLTRAVSIENQIRSLNVTMSAFGSNAIASAANVQKMLSGLREIGLSTGEAQEAGLAVVRTPRINPARAPQIVEIGANLAAAFGGDTVSRAKEVADATSKNVDALVNLALSYNALSGPEASRALRLAEQGKSAEALDMVLNKLSDTLRGKLLDSMSSFGKMAHAMSNAWNAFLDNLARSQVITAIVNKMTELAQAVERIMKGSPGLAGNMLTGAAIGAVGGATLGLAGAGIGAVPGALLGAIGGAAYGYALPADTAVWNKSVITSPIPGATIPTGTRTTAAAATEAASMVGLNENRDRSTIAAYLASGGANLDPATVAWCAAFANAALARQGISGTGSNIATSFLNWGQAVTGDVLGGDIMVQAKGNTAGQTGGHVGFATGAAKQTEQGLMLEMVSGNRNDQVTKDFVLASEVQLRRATEAQGAVLDPNQIATSVKLVNEEIVALSRRLDVVKQQGLASELVAEQQRVEQFIRENNISSIREGNKESAAEVLQQQAKVAVVNKYKLELDKQTEAINLTNKGLVQTAGAYDESTAAGLRANAMAQARSEIVLELGKTEGIEAEVQTRAQRIMLSMVAEQTKATKEAAAALVPEVVGQQKLADAYKISAAAGHEQELQNQATAQAQGLINAANVSGSDAVKKTAEDTRLVFLARAKIIDQAKILVDLEKANVQSFNETQALQLQQSLVGQKPEIVQGNVAVLNEINKIKATGVSLDDEQVKRRIQVVTAVEQEKARLQEVQREWQRVEDMVRSVAESISNTLVQSFSDFLDGKKIDDWGARMKTMLNSLMKQIVEFSFIRPAIGTALGGLGFGNLATQFGSFGGMSNAASIGGNGAVTLVPNGQGGFNLSNVSGGLGLANNLSGGSSSSLMSELGLGGTTNWLNTSAGGALGFGIPGAPFSATVAGPSALGATGAGAPMGSLFSGTLTSAVGGVGAGLGAGMFLNSLVGGNSTGGMVGSGLGAGLGVLGAALAPSTFGISLLLGGLLGGAGGGLLGGLFGNNKPRNASAGANFDLSTGQVFGAFSGGDPKIDQTMQTVAQGVDSVLKALTNAGGTLQGNLLIQNGVNTGITADSTLPGFEGRFNLGKDPLAAIKMIGLALTQSVEGVSDTVKTVLDQTYDLNKLEENLQFAEIYDNIEKAAEDAFSSVEDASKRAGPFNLSMQQITLTFDEITKKTTEFGLSLESVNAALAEATKRLQDDFRTAIDNSLNAAKGLGFVGDIQAAWDQYFASTVEANSLGLTPAIDPQLHIDLGQIFTEQVNAILAGLSPEEIDFAVAELDNLSGTVFPDLAASAKATAEALGIVSAQFQSLYDLQQSLISGDLAGLTPVASYQAATDEYNKLLAQVRAGDNSQATLDALAASGQNLITTGTTAYGNSPEIAQLREAIIDTIDQILNGRAFAKGTMFTPPGLILVGERGPEYMMQQGGARIFDAPTTQRMMVNPPSFGENMKFADGTDLWDNRRIESKLDRMISLLERNNTITRLGASETINSLGSVEKTIVKGQQPQVTIKALRPVG